MKQRASREAIFIRCHSEESSDEQPAVCAEKCNYRSLDSLGMTTKLKRPQQQKFPVTFCPQDWRFNDVGAGAALCKERLANFFNGGKLGRLIAYNATFADVFTARLKLWFYQHDDFEAPAFVGETR